MYEGFKFLLITMSIIVDLKFLLITTTIIVYMVSNMILPISRLSSFHYNKKKEFWIELIIPYFLVFKAIYWTVKYLKKEIKEEYKILKESYKFLD